MVSTENYNNPPTVEITYPNQGFHSGTITIEGIADDPDNLLDRVEIQIDNGIWNEATGTFSWSYNWDTTLLDDGVHRIHARSFDGDNYSPIDEESVTVYNYKVVADAGGPYSGNIGGTIQLLSKESEIL